MVTAVGVVLRKPVADGPDAGRYISECGAVGWEVCVCVILLFPLFLLGNGRLKKELVPRLWGNR